MAFRLGIIGNGSIAQTHAQHYKELGDRVEFVACCDIVPERAKAFAEKYGFAHYYTDCKTMLENEKLDGVSVCTWNAAHAECTIAALNAGVNVLCEKPMAMNAKEAQAMKEAAERNGKLLMIGFVKRQGADVLTAKRLVEEGLLGDVYYMKATYLRRDGFPGGWFGTKKYSGGGPLIDLGVHIIDAARYMIGCPKPVEAFGATFDKIGTRPDLIRKGGGYMSSTNLPDAVFDVEDLASAMVRFDNGAVLHFEASFALNMAASHSGLTLYGSKGGLQVDPDFELYTTTGNMLSNTKFDGPTKADIPKMFHDEMRNFVDAVEGKAECKALADDGIALMKILDAVYLSAQTGKSVTID